MILEAVVSRACSRRNLRPRILEEGVIMSTISEETILGALKAIIDPDFKKDIVSLGFIKNIQISSGSVSLDIELTTQACPLKAEFKKTAEKILSGLKGVNRVTVNMTSRKNPVQ